MRGVLGSVQVSQSDCVRVRAALLQQPHIVSIQVQEVGVLVEVGVTVMVSFIEIIKSEINNSYLSKNSTANKKAKKQKSFECRPVARHFYWTCLIQGQGHCSFRGLLLGQDGLPHKGRPRGTYPHFQGKALPLSQPAKARSLA